MVIKDSLDEFLQWWNINLIEGCEKRHPIWVIYVSGLIVSCLALLTRKTQAASQLSNKGEQKNRRSAAVSFTVDVQIQGAVLSTKQRLGGSVTRKLQRADLKLTSFGAKRITCGIRLKYLRCGLLLTPDRWVHIYLCCCPNTIIHGHHHNSSKIQYICIKTSLVYFLFFVSTSNRNSSHSIALLSHFMS